MASRLSSTSTIVEPRKRASLTGYIIVIVILVVVLFVLIGILIYYLTRPKANTTDTTTTKTCESDADCDSPLVCDLNASPSTCKRNTNDNCVTDVDCISNNICVSERCKGKYGANCATDGDCAANGICVTGECSTVPKPCSTTSECIMPGLDSTQVDCSSRATTTTCFNDATCQSSVSPLSTCDLSTNKCVIKLCGLKPGQKCDDPIQCIGTAGCDTFLSPAECRLQPTQACTSSDQCEKDSSCVSGTCTYKTCDADEDCFGGEVCTAKRCVPDTCSSDTDCVVTYQLGAGWKCVQDASSNGHCVNNGDSCPAGCTDVELSCNGSVCLNALFQPCSSNTECASAQCDQTLVTPTCTAKACTSGAQCPASNPVCKFGFCAPCANNADCVTIGQTTCTVSTGRCT